MKPLDVHSDGAVDVPAATSGPLVTAFGIALLFASLATHALIGLVGAVLAVAGGLEWLKQVFPYPAHERVVPAAGEVMVVTERRDVEQAVPAVGLARAHLPLELYPISAGLRGGAAGGVVMAALAAAYGWVSGHGFWYPINLLAAGFFPGMTDAQLSSFQPLPFAIACVIHTLASLLVGVLYGALLPLLPRRPILLGGLIAPLTWTGLLHPVLSLVNPALALRVDWGWFALSQLGFGLIAGLVVSRRERIATYQPWPFAVRAGVEATGLGRNSNQKDGNA